MRVDTGDDMKKNAAVAAVVILLALVAGAWAAWWRVQNRFVVRNETGQKIMFLTVTINGETARIENIPASASRSGRFSIGTDDHFVIRGRLADESEIAAEYGYVTNGMYGERAEFVIRPGGEL